MWSRIWHNLLSQTSMLLLYVWDRHVRCGFYDSQSVETWVGAGAVWCPGFLFPSTLRSCGCLSSGTCHRVAAHVACWPTGTYQCWAVLIFLWEPVGSGSYILLWEPDRFSNILFFLAIGTDQVIKILKYSKFTQFSIRAVLACIITLSFQIRFSQPGSPIFQKL
jgi:hypothetical protein